MATSVVLRFCTVVGSAGSVVLVQYHFFLYIYIYINSIARTLDEEYKEYKKRNSTTQNICKGITKGDMMP